MNKIILLICVIFTQINTTAQTSDSKLMQINRRKEIKGNLNSDFFTQLKEKLPDSDINPNELLTIFYFPQSNNCPSFITKVELEKVATEYKMDLEKNIPNNFLVVLTNKDLAEGELKKANEISNFVKTTFFTNEYHCYNRILVYKKQFIALLGDYNDDEALERIKKIVK